jgi:transposase
MCGHRAHQIQSRYTRHLTDVACLGKSVHLVVVVRRFWCRHPDCPRRIFAERLGPLAKVYARRTTRLCEQLRILGFACGAALGARVAQYLALSVSPTTLLRLLRSTLLPSPTPTTVLGVDDFSWRRGVRYGTILCDLEQRRPLAVLPDCSVATFASWLKQHPGVEIISRDRGGIYAEGARRGAPGAEQVADRWHLLKNLGDALERYLIRTQHLLFTSGMVVSPSTPVPATSSVQEDPVSPGISRRKRRLEQVLALQTEGKSVRAIARELGLARNTVRKYLRYQSLRPHDWPGLASQRRSLLDPYRDELRVRWEAGCHNARELFDGLRAVGYRGGLSQVKAAVTRLRRGLPVRPAPQHRWSVRQVRWLLMRPRDRLKESETQFLTHLLMANPEVAHLYEVLQAFGRMLRTRCAERLEPWLQQAAATGISELCSFVGGIERDYAAVANALQYAFSQGPVEGQITRLKLLKRAMYGRAKPDLLERRVLFRL